MALLFIDACESFTNRDAMWQAGASATTTVTASYGGRCFRIPFAGPSLSFAPQSTLVFGERTNVTRFSTATAGILSFKGDGGVTTHLTLAVAPNGQLRLYRGTAGGTLLASSVQTISPNVWYYLELKLTVADTGGIAIVRVDGAEWINFTGDTRNTGTATTLDAISFAQASSNEDVYVDDLYLANTTGPAPYNDFLGDVSVARTYVNGNGASSQFVGSDGDSADNYLHLDETTDVPTTTDYVGSSTPGQRDLYTLSDISSNSTVLAVRAGAYAAKSDAGAASLKVLLRGAAGTITSGAATPLSLTYTHIPGEIRTANPDGGAWTVSDVNNLQVGVESA